MNNQKVTQVAWVSMVERCHPTGGKECKNYIFKKNEGENLTFSQMQITQIISVYFSTIV